MKSNVIVIKELATFKEQNTQYGLKHDTKLAEAEGGTRKLKSSICLIQLCSLFSNATLSKDKVKVRKAVIEATSRLGSDKDAAIALFPKAIRSKIGDAVRLR